MTHMHEDILFSFHLLGRNHCDMMNMGFFRNLTQRIMCDAVLLTDDNIKSKIIEVKSAELGCDVVTCLNLQISGCPLGVTFRKTTEVVSLSDEVMMTLVSGSNITRLTGCLWILGMWR